jgi:hypothetical protein
MFFSMSAFAGGKLQLEPRYNATYDKTNYMVGLAIYERLIGKTVFYNSWSGFGDTLEETQSNYRSWYTTKHAIDFKLGAFTVSPGVRFVYYSQPDEGQTNNDIQTEFFGKLSIELW